MLNAIQPAIAVPHPTYKHEWRPLSVDAVVLENSSHDGRGAEEPLIHEAAGERRSLVVGAVYDCSGLVTVVERDRPPTLSRRRRATRLRMAPYCLH